MKKTLLIIPVSLAALAIGATICARDASGLRVPGGLSFSEFKGYESWSVIAISQNHGRFAVILGNPVMIQAYKSGIPENGNPFPDGSKMAKIHWDPKTQEREPGRPIVPGTLHDVDFMVKDAKRFEDSAGWGWAAFEYDAATSSFRPADSTDKPPQGDDAKCGLACHTLAKSRDFVFTQYAKR
jgi:hypothetical protein